jgi:HD superfamily phosphohydrolase
MKRIYDPIHHFIEIDGAEVALLDTPVLQRLRRLRQLGLAYLVFPGAEHSRFSHALGALAFGERIFESLKRHSPEYFSSDADYARQRRLMRAALLLHDIGHGPFSHAVEPYLGSRHEARTAAILQTPELRAAIERIGVEPAELSALIVGDRPAKYPVLKEIVSGPNLDADRMDYLLRDAHFTGVTTGSYDSEQLIASLRVYSNGGEPALGVDGRGVVSLESFVLARYLMFATVYFHHTTRMYERVLEEALAEIWPDPRALDPIETYLAWDDFRVIEVLRTAHSAAGIALREREKLYGVAAEFNAARDLEVYERSRARLAERFGSAVWADAQEQLLHRLPLGQAAGAPTVYVGTRTGIVDAREASDLIAKLTGKAYWRKLFVRKESGALDEARRICQEIAGGLFA